MRTTSALLLAVLLIASVAHALPADKKPVVIAAALALTGTAASFGNGELNGITLAVEDWNSNGGINGSPIELLVEDTRSESMGTVTAVKSLIHIRKQKLLLGPTWLDTFGGALPVLDQAGALALTPSAAAAVMKKSGEQFPLVFSTWFPLDNEVRRLVSYLESQKVASVMLAFDNDPFFQAFQREIVSRLAGTKITVKAHESFNIGEKDFRTFMSRPRALKSGGIILGLSDEASLHSFLRQRADLLPDVPLYGTDCLDVFAQSPAFADLFEGVTYVYPALHESSFVSRYRARFKIEPSTSSSTAYDAAVLLFRSLKEGHSSPADVARYLREGSHDTMTFGMTRFDSLGGISVSDYVIKQIKNGIGVTVSESQ